jgi:hypothetical protein
MIRRHGNHGTSILAEHLRCKMTFISQEEFVIIGSNFWTTGNPDKVPTELREKKGETINPCNIIEAYGGVTGFISLGIHAFFIHHRPHHPFMTYHRFNLRVKLEYLDFRGKNRGMIFSAKILRLRMTKARPWGNQQIAS